MKKAALLIEPTMSFDWYPDRLGVVNVSPIVTAIMCHADVCSFMFCMPTKPPESSTRNYLWEFLNSKQIDLDELLAVARRTNRISSYVYLDGNGDIQLLVRFFEKRNQLPVALLITTILRVTGDVIDTKLKKK